MSPTGHLAGSVASQAMRGTGQQVGLAIGKPINGLQTSSSGSSGRNDINWVDFNYPPALRLIHYSAEELPTSLSGLVHCMNLSFVITCTACALNLLDTLIVHFSAEAPGKWLLQSAIHLLLLPAAALGVFYAGYRGLVEPDPTLNFRFKVGQPALGLIYLLLAIIPAGCVNGFAMFSKVSDYAPNGHSFWMTAILMESLLWLLNCALAVLNTVRADRHDSYGIGGTASMRF